MPKNRKINNNQFFPVWFSWNESRKKRSFYLWLKHFSYALCVEAERFEWVKKRYWINIKYIYFVCVMWPMNSVCRVYRTEQINRENHQDQSKIVFFLLSKAKQTKLIQNDLNIVPFQYCISMLFVFSFSGEN